MAHIYFQALFATQCDFLDILKRVMLRIAEEYEDSVDKDNIDDCIQIGYTKKLSNDRFLIGFKINVNDTLTPEAIRAFCEYVDDDKNCEFVIKFKDRKLFESLKAYYEEIFHIEMQLREILSFIFISTYENDCYSFLEFQKQKINATVKNVKEEDIPAFFKKKYQNEFFYLTFNQYQQLKLPDVIKSETLINLLADSKSLDELKKSILKMGAIKPEKNEYLEFLNRISENLASIEALRNCVAHNREPTDDELENYILARDKLTQELSDFYKKLLSACPKCGGVVETKQTEHGHDGDGQPSVIHFVIRCKECDEVFEDNTVDV